MKVEISISPFCAITVLSFLKEFDEELKNNQKTIALKRAIEEFENTVLNSMNEEQFQDAKAEIEVNCLIGICPDKRL